jgi:hypothetical protein
MEQSEKKGEGKKERESTKINSDQIKANTNHLQPNYSTEMFGYVFGTNTLRLSRYATAIQLAPLPGFSSLEVAVTEQRTTQNAGAMPKCCGSPRKPPV